MEERQCIGLIERFDLHDGFAADAEADLAGDDDRGSPIRNREDALDERGGLVDDVLAVVEHDEGVATGDGGDGLIAALVFDHDAKCSRDDGKHGRARSQGCELDEVGPVRPPGVPGS